MSKTTHGKTKKPRQRGVSRLADGRWRVRVYATDARTGKQKETQRTLPATMSHAEVLAEVARLKDELALGGGAPPPERTSLSDCAVRWLEAAAARTKRSTSELYLEVLERRVLPVIGDLFVDALERQDIERWVRWAERQRRHDGRLYGRETLKGWWRVLVQFVRDVCADHGVADPIVRIRPPRGRAGRTRDRRTLNADELGRVLAEVEREAPQRYAEVYVLAHTGMRPGELFALEWRDIDEERGKIVIERAVRRGTVDTPKTEDPREVALTQGMRDVLRVHRRGLIADQHPGLSRGLVFPSTTGGHRGPESLHKPLHRAGVAAGVEVRVGPQVLRRTFNTLMVEAGVDRIVLRSQMGHCSEEMTERYSGVPVESKRLAVAGLEARTTGGRDDDPNRD